MASQKNRTGEPSRRFLRAIRRHTFLAKSAAVIACIAALATILATIVDFFRSEEFAAPLELASTYSSNFTKLLFSPLSPAEKCELLSMNLELKNISQQNLTNVSVFFDKTFLHGHRQKVLTPYDPPLKRPSNVVRPTPARTYLEPGGTIHFELSRTVEQEEKEFLFLFYDRAPRRVTMFLRHPTQKIELQFDSRDARAFRMLLISPIMDSPDSRLHHAEYIGVLFWVRVNYEVNERRVQCLFFGGLIAPIVVNEQGALVFRCKAVHDFVIRMPYAITTDSKTNKTHEHFVRLDTKLNLETPDHSLLVWFPVQERHRKLWEAPVVQNFDKSLGE